MRPAALSAQRPREDFRLPPDSASYRCSDPPSRSRRGRLRVVALFVVLLLGFALGIWGTYRAVYPEKGVHRLTAVFQARAGETAILVRHEAAPALAMGEMELMAFDLESKTLLDQAGLKPGDRVRLTIRQIPPNRLVVVRMDKLP